jgi:hypothetical protein
VDPEFQRILIRVVSLGLIIAAIGGAGVFFAFRGYGEQPSHRRTLGPAMVLLLGFVLICCLILLKLSFAR